MKTRKFVNIMLTVILVASFAFFALASSSEEKDQGKDAADSSNAAATANNELGEYQIDIKECRLAKDYEGADIVIVKYGFTNNSDEAASFGVVLYDRVYQNGIELEKSYFVDDSANYSSDNQLKSIKKGATLDVEVAYKLNDTSSDIEVEVKELISLNEVIIKKTFTLN